MIEILKQAIIVDEKLKYKFAELGITTYWDALLCIPLRYEDFTKVYQIADSHVGMQALIEGDIASVEVVTKRTKQLQVTITDGTHYIILIFFHFYPNYTTQYKIGKKIRVFGEIKLNYSGQKTIIHPKIKSMQEYEIVKLSNTFTPIYPSVKGLSQGAILELVEHALTLMDIPEVIPKNSMNESNYMSINQALLTLHKLTPQQYMDNLHIRAIERLKFDEVLAQQLLMRNAYLFKHQDIANQFTPLMNLVTQCKSKLSFKLTNAQQRVFDEIINDLTRPIQMNRLLQGDVGSGKTIVATLAMLCAVENNYQACILAPTEILAEQHYNKIKYFLAGLNICIVWLTGSLRNKQKADA
ncbi:MAG: DEAD/DEAH box helicase, partial [Burkholderiales bacterium]|nr:DEAD/DEAH box helicase [Burkholderiales bacterium]